LDSRWTREIRRRKAAAAIAAASKVAGVGLPGATARFSNPIAHGDRGGRSEPAHDLYTAGERSERHTPWPAAMELSGERGQGARKPRNAREKDEERAGEKGKLTSAMKTGEDGLVRRIFAWRSPMAFLRCF